MKIADVSSYQGNINWDLAIQELDFVILRSSVGDKIDKAYRNNAEALERLRFPYHAYHYVKAINESQAISEAKVFATSTAGTKPLFYVIDAEYKSINRTKAKNIMEAFEQELRNLLGQNIRVAIYIANKLYKKWNLDYARYAYVWIPRYGANTGKPDKEPIYYCDLWQYTSKGRVNGIKGNVDLSEIPFLGEHTIEYFLSDKPNLNYDKVKPLIIKHTLRQGDIGGEVIDLQKQLIELGYDLGEENSNGIFGSQTKYAVKQFQRDHELVIDGIVGKRTWAVLSML